MKNKLYVCLMLLFIIVLAACGSDESAANSDASAGKEEDAETTEETGADEEAEEAEPALETDGDIIATTVAIVEMMDALELDLVGVPTSYKDLPARYDGVTEIGMAMDPDMETILSLKPTDVLTVTTLTDYVQDSFSETDVPATYMNLDSVENMYEEIEALGDKYNREEHAAELVTDFEEKLAEVEAKIEGKESPKVLILLGVPGSYLVATENSYVGDLVRRAGGTNAIEDTDLEYVSANTEVLQQTDADIILRMSHGMPDEVVEMFHKEFQENDIWSHFKAVQNDRVYDLEETRFGTTANLAAVEALEELVGLLHRELAE
ncbi:heme ABC transporter substrate-binding protein IsdE [Oceanobacillus alkalisoli]|uniref:heme ABC transporter substrate-binding protein IsdE n=1 Tax=Oceanobacillus alkalisoli TaxID=2925113 RepID=UPI001EF1376F|nr:heme ABC transporter substrate-binding protein IsdE [Oceanobacillus alkalisoli]MCF3943392.1 heme ABC transporter substrate-binding protein IsdE [Oceanobacillus alkalisoli]MCG5103981.1 heme ABC transporter substrate-binding protein IsdE [Oceanobacillus alkalisoli]